MGGVNASISADDVRGKVPLAIGDRVSVIITKILETHVQGVGIKI